MGGIRGTCYIRASAQRGQEVSENFHNFLSQVL
jgi:hypothetical protein